MRLMGIYMKRMSLRILKHSEDAKDVEKYLEDLEEAERYFKNEGDVEDQDEGSCQQQLLEERNYKTKQSYVLCWSWKDDWPKEVKWMKVWMK